MSLGCALIRLDHLFLLQAQALKLFYSPDTSETADAMRQIISLSSQMLDASTETPSEKASENDREIAERETSSAESSGEHTEVSRTPRASIAPYSKCLVCVAALPGVWRTPWLR